MAVIEFAKNMLKIKNAGSTELNKSCYPVIGLMNEWNKGKKVFVGTDKKLGGTMRPVSYTHLTLPTIYSV